MVEAVLHCCSCSEGTGSTHSNLLLFSALRLVHRPQLLLALSIGGTLCSTIEDSYAVHQTMPSAARPPTSAFNSSLNRQTVEEAATRISAQHDCWEEEVAYSAFKDETQHRCALLLVTQFAAGEDDYLSCLWPPWLKTFTIDFDRSTYLLF